MKLTIPLTQIEIEDGCHLIAAIWINGSIARMIIDSGASATVFDEKRLVNYVSPETARIEHRKVSSGLGVDKVKVSGVILDKIQIGDLRLYEFEANAMNLSSISRAYYDMKEKPVEGVLGSDILKRYRAIINYDELKLVLFI